MLCWEPSGPGAQLPGADGAEDAPPPGSTLQARQEYKTSLAGDFHWTTAVFEHAVLRLQGAPRSQMHLPHLSPFLHRGSDLHLE